MWALVIALLLVPMQAQVPGISKHGKDEQDLVEFLKYTQTIENSPARKYEKNFDPSKNTGSTKGQHEVQIFLPGLIHNAAVGQPCSASSFYGEGVYSQYLSIEDKFVDRDFSKYSCENANDGSPYSTFWWSARKTAGQPVWWEVSIPAGINRIDHINIRWYGWNSASEYVISSSDSGSVGNHLWTDRLVMSDMVPDPDRLDKLVPLDFGWDGENIKAIRITMMRHIACTDVARCRKSRASQNSDSTRRIYGIREVEVVGYDSSARGAFGSAGALMQIVTMLAALILMRPSWLP